MKIMITPVVSIHIPDIYRVYIGLYIGLYFGLYSTIMTVPGYILSYCNIYGLNWAILGYCNCVGLYIFGYSKCIGSISGYRGLR